MSLISVVGASVHAPALTTEAEVPSSWEWRKTIPLHRHVLLDARWCFYALEAAELVVSDAEIFKLRHVFQHARESCKGELLSVEAFGVAMAVDEVALKLAAGVNGARVGEFEFFFLCLLKLE